MTTTTNRRSLKTVLSCSTALLFLACAGESGDADSAMEPSDRDQSLAAVHTDDFGRTPAVTDVSRAPEGTPDTGSEGPRVVDVTRTVHASASSPSRGRVLTGREPEGAPLPASSEDGSVSVAEVVALGTGCPSGSIEYERGPSGQVTGLRLREYVARVQAGSTASLKDCQLAVRVNNPKGYSYALKSISYEGRAALTGTGKADLFTRSYFQGEPAAAVEGTTKSFTAADQGSYAFTSVYTPERAVWSRCDAVRDLNVSTRVRLLGGGEQSVEISRISGIALMARPCAPTTEATPTAAPDAERGTIVLVR